MLGIAGGQHPCLLGQRSHHTRFLSTPSAPQRRAAIESVGRLSLAPRNPVVDADQASAYSFHEQHDAQNVAGRVINREYWQHLPPLITSEVIGQRAFVG